MGAMAGRQNIVRGQCEAARDAYLRERETVLRALSRDAKRVGVELHDDSYLKVDLVCDADK